MIIFPAIDIRGGKCVRLHKGLKEKQTIYEENPLKQAQKFMDEGAEFIHIVDLDAAFLGVQQNFPIIGEIIQKIGIKIQVGGGIRDMQTAEKLFAAGVERIVLGTILVKNTREAKNIIQRYGSSVILGLDCRKDFIATDGWEEASSIKAEEVIAEYRDFAVKEAVYTNIERDGTLEGADVESAVNLANKANFNIILSGGVAGIEDVAEARKHQNNISGIIIGKALYENKISLKQALQS